MPAAGKDGSIARSPAFVDRTEEKTILEKALKMAWASKGNMVLVRGEAGIGKTRLVEQVLETAGRHDFMVLRGECLEYRRSPYEPFREMLKEHFGLDRNLPPAENIRRINSRIASDHPSLAEHKTLLSEFFYPVDEPVGGFSIDPSDLQRSFSYLRKKGYRLVYLADAENVDVIKGPFPATETYTLGFGAKERIDPRRLERIARLIREGFQRYSHSAIFIGDMDSLLTNHDKGKVLQFMSICDSISSSCGGLMGYIRTPMASSLLLHERDLADHIGDSDPPEAPSVADGGDKRSLSIIEVLSRIFRDLSQEKPVLTLVEDLHWGDKSTFNLLQYLARNISEQRHLIIGTFRDEHLLEDDRGGTTPIKEALQRFTREHLYEEVQLAPLSCDHVSKLLENIIGSAPEGPLLEEVMAETEGNPLFIIELMKLKLGGTENPVPIMEGGVQSAVSLVRRRLDALEDRSRLVLEQACVLNQQATLDALAAILGLDTEEVLDSVDDLISLKFLLEKDEGIAFEHSKVRESIYDLMGDDRKRTMHISVARFLDESMSPDHPEKTALLAYHYLRGGEARKALEYLMQILDSQKQLIAPEEVLDQMIKGIDMLGEDAPDRSSLDFKARVFLRMGDLQESLEMLNDASRSFQRAIDICEAEGLDPLLAPAYRRLGGLMLRFYKWDHTVDYYLRALHLSKKNEDQSEISKAFWGLGRMYFLKGDYQRSLECIIKYLETPTHTKGGPYVKGLTGLGDVYKEIGDFNQALVYYKMAVKTSEEYDLQMELAIAYTRMARVLLRLNELEDAERFADWGHSIARNLTRSEVKREVSILYSEVMLDLGIIRKAEECLATLPTKDEDRSEDILLRAMLMRTRGVLYSRIRDHDRAMDSFSKAIQVLERIQVPHQLGRTYLEYGLARFQAMDVKGAIDMISRANDIFKGLRSVYYQNRTSSKLRELRFIAEGMKEQ